jgi:hypothetical protein
MMLLRWLQTWIVNKAYSILVLFISFAILFRVISSSALENRSNISNGGDNNCGIPVVVLSHNNPTFVKNIIEQLQTCFGATVIIVDNGSTWPAMLKLLSQFELDGIEVHRFGNQHGPRVIFTKAGDELYRKLPRYFAYTDSDLLLNPLTPKNFLCVLKHATEIFRFPKVGLALDISDSTRMWKFEWFNKQTIFDWENGFWSNPIQRMPVWPQINGLAFEATIDTTFAVYDKNLLPYRTDSPEPRFTASAIRLAGHFSCKHLPWYPEIIASVPESEINQMYSHSHGTFASVFSRLESGFFHLVFNTSNKLKSIPFFQNNPIAHFQESAVCRNRFIFFPLSESIL